MRRALAIVFASAFLALSPYCALAQEQAPEADRAGMCDDFEGLAFTFCVALCEARTCDLLPAGDERCTLLRHAFDDLVSGAAPPCALAGIASSARATN